MEQPISSDSNVASPDAAPPRVPGPGRRRSALFAHLLTALFAVLVSQLITVGSDALNTRQAVLYQTATSVPTRTLSPTVTATVALPVSDAAQLQLDVRSLQADRDQLWSALYLLRSALLLDDAVNALAVNDRSEADRALLAARQALDRAYQLSAEQARDPIDQIRLQIARLRDDLDIRPEGADRRLRQLRRLVLALVDEG